MLQHQSQNTKRKYRSAQSEQGIVCGIKATQSRLPDILSRQSIIPKPTTPKPKATELTRPRYQTRSVTRRDQAIQREKEEQESAKQLRDCQLLVEDWVRYKQLNPEPPTEGEITPPGSINWETWTQGKSD